MSKRRKPGLARGLDDLLGGAGAAPEAAPEPAERELPLTALEPNPFQPRREFEETALETLAASIRRQGLLQPIVVRPKPGVAGAWQIIAGERRFRAAERAGLERVPVIVREVDDGDALLLALLENLQREDLGPLELAGGLQRLIDDFALTQKELGRVLGLSRSRVANSLRLLRLPQAVRELLTAGRLCEAHGRTLAAIEDAELATALARLAVDKELTVRELERLVAAEREASSPESAGKTDSREQASADPDLRLYEDDLQRRLGTKVSIRRRSSGRGRIVIEFYSADELAGLYERLSGERPGR